MKIRSFTDENGIVYSYDPEAPELIRNDGDASAAVAPRHTLHEEANCTHTTTLYPEGIEPSIVNSIDQVLDFPVLEAYCTSEFWESLTEKDFIKILSSGKDYLLVHVEREKLWNEILTFKGYCELLEKNRKDLLIQYCPWNFTPEDWLAFLTQKKSSSEFFKFCSNETLECFTPENWQTLLLFDPDFYLCNSRSNRYLTDVKNIPVRFWIRHICADKPQLKPDHFPASCKVEKEDIYFILDQPRPELSFVNKKDLDELTEDQWLKLLEKNKSTAAYCRDYKSIKKFIGSSTCCKISGFAAALVFLIAALLFHADLLYSVIGVVLFGVFSALFCKAWTAKLFFSMSQSVLLGIAFGIAFCACIGQSFLFPYNLLLSFIYSGIIFLISGIFWLLYKNKPIAYCKSQFKGYTWLLPLVLILFFVAQNIVTFRFTAEQQREIAGHFHLIRFQKLEYVFMERYIGKSSRYQKNLQELNEALSHEKLSECLNAFEKLSSCWQDNPSLTQLADNVARLLVKLEFDSKNAVAQAVRGRDLLGKYVRKNKRELEKKETEFRKQAQELLASFGKDFDKHGFPPKTDVVKSVKTNFVKIKDIYSGFPEIFISPLDLKFGWSLCFDEKKEALKVLKGMNKGSAHFFGVLMERGISAENFTVKSKTEIFRTVISQFPSDGEMFFSLLMEYNYQPETVSYLLALSQKTQGKAEYLNTLETAILKGYPDINGYYLSWNTDSDKQKDLILEKIIHDQTPGKEKAAVNLAGKAYRRKDYLKSWQNYQKFYKFGGKELPGDHIMQMNHAYYECHKGRINASIQKFIGEFDRVYSDKTSVKPPVDFEYERCIRHLEQDFIWRYCYSVYHHPENPAAKDQAERRLRAVKCPEAEYLLAKMHKSGNELPINAIRIGSSAKFRKIKLEAVKLKVLSNRFSVKERMEGINYLFEQGELSVEDKLAAGRFFIAQNKLDDAQKILSTMPDSGEKSYELFRCMLERKNETEAKRNLESALRQGYKVPYEDYKKLFTAMKGHLIELVVSNKGNGYENAALDLARSMSKEQNWVQSVKFYREADKNSFTQKDHKDFALALWETGTNDHKEREYSLRWCTKLSEDRISADLAWDIYQFLLKKDDPAAGAWLKEAARKGNFKAVEKRYMSLRTDDSSVNIEEKNQLWKICIERGVKEAILDAVNAIIEEKKQPFSKKEVIQAGEKYYNNLPPVDKVKKENKELKENLEAINDL